MATSAAPTYFPTYRSAAGTPLIDGGMWANNPAGVAAVEALGVLGWERSDVKLLSLGCTTEPLRVNANQTTRLGVNYWARRLLPEWPGSHPVLLAQLLSSLAMRTCCVTQLRFQTGASS